jgi:hypothetical protein
MILIELGITCANADVDAIIDAFRGAALLDERLHVEIEEIAQSGSVDLFWGHLIDPTNPADYAAAIEDASTGDAEIKTFRDPNAGFEFDALICRQPYREQTEEALRTTGLPFFEYSSSFVTIRLSFDQDSAPLELHFDRNANKTASACQKDGHLWIDPTDTYYLDGWSPRAVDAYARAIDLASILDAHCDVKVDDPSGYLESRDREDVVRYFAQRRQDSSLLESAGKEYWQGKNVDRWIDEATSAVNAAQMPSGKSD